MKRSFNAFVARLREIGLFDEVDKRSRAANITLMDLYDGQGRRPSIGAARKTVYTWLVVKKGKSVNEVAELFGRAPSGVLKLVEKQDG